ncbi:DUF6438 domain-containing protein [Arenimonas oryziterrae]|uniref:DUF6438 domain-containing protein n=1 Tax=Arenimonas oryziterrae DSM 21050 = YC6267 TaxID=1121015 RepID=A0A091AYF4_9GAMM|nr:DUF6438 domain-containing protein [Arenimonas oryziterrae]KFN43694.1 hypothetical protein N789_10480 [Arenimonas oryziterrae DSM 21050 = YC6267]
MRVLTTIIVLLFSGLCASCGTPPAPQVGVCSVKPNDAQAVDLDVAAAHRRTPLPVITYPFGTEIEGDWGFNLTLRIDASGRVACYGDRDRLDRVQVLTPRQRAVIGTLKDWRYQPFEQEGKAVPAVVVEQIAEVEAVEKHVPLPQVPLDQVVIALSRSGCYGTCPIYQVEIHGDGRVVYQGDDFVDVRGTHAYRVPVEEVRRLVDSLREKDIWSLRESYRGGWTDHPTYKLTMTLGDQKKELVDYIGQRKGMPPAASEFEREVDKVARSAMWINLSGDAIATLRAEGFDFHAQEAADILARASENPYSTDDEAKRELLELQKSVIQGSAEKTKIGSE